MRVFAVLAAGISWVSACSVRSLDEDASDRTGAESDGSSDEDGAATTSDAGETGEVPSAPPCEPQLRASCVCDDGTFGTALCGDSQVWGPCEGCGTGEAEGCSPERPCGEIDPTAETCDPWSFDCPDGEKCRFISNTYFSCVPVGDSPPGEPCTVVEGTLPQRDTCDETSVCLEANDGALRCVEMCTGTPTNPACPQTAGQGATCISLSFRAVCLVNCDPLETKPCPTEKNCIPVWKNGSGSNATLTGAICHRPANEGTAGEECGCANCCAEGHMCVEGEQFGPPCDETPCCTRVCRTDGDSPPCAPNQSCVAIFPPDHPLEHVGRCVVVP